MSSSLVLQSEHTLGLAWSVFSLWVSTGFREHLRELVPLHKPHIVGFLEIFDNQVVPEAEPLAFADKVHGGRGTPTGEDL